MNRFEMYERGNGGSVPETSAAQELSLSGWDLPSGGKLSNFTDPINPRHSSLSGSRRDALEDASRQLKSHLNDMHIGGLDYGRKNPEPRGTTDRARGPRDANDRGLGFRMDNRGKVELVEFRNLKNSYRSGGGPGAAPDATVIMSKHFDPNKPVNVIFFNHGHFGSGKDWADRSKLGEKMAAADPNTIMVIPEWQTRPGTQDNTRTASSQPNFYRNQLQEIFDRTPQLKGKTVDNVKSISIIAHSAGVNPAKSQLNDNGFGTKVTSVTVLDAMYVADAYDGWVRRNAADLARGRKQLTVVYRGDSESTSGVPRRELMERHTKRALGQYQVPESAYDRGRINGADPTVRPRGGVLFTFDADHMGLPARHVARVVADDRWRQTQFA